MAFHCAWCNSPMLQAGADTYQCLACGKKTNFDGTPGQNMTYPDVHPQVMVEEYAAPDTENPDRRRRPGDPDPSPPVEEIVINIIEEPPVPPAPEPAPSAETVPAPEVASVPPAEAPAPEPVLAPVAPEDLSTSEPPVDAAPAPVDSTTLTPEQQAAIAPIVPPEGA